MARRNANLAGLAALGALGYKLANPEKTSAPVEDRVGTPVSDTSDQDGGNITPIRQSLEDTSDQDGGGITAIRPSVKKTSSTKPSAPVMMSREDEDKIRAGKPRGRTSGVAAPKQTMGKTYPYQGVNLRDEDAPSSTTFTMKRGGKVKKMASGGMAKAEKSAAKGWGKARGARGAKYY